MNCTKYPFDYWKRIVIKDIIGTDYRFFANYKEVFQGVDLNRCDDCMVEGYVSVSIPFNMADMTTEELHCTLLSMGLKEMSFTDLELMSELITTEDGFLCEHCNEVLEEFDIIDLSDN